jgi:hypothetical protein
MVLERSKSPRQLDNSGLADRLQSILVNAAKGQRSLTDDRQYPRLRQELARRQITPPPLIHIHPTVDSFTAYIRSAGERPQVIERVRREFDDLYRSIEAAANPGVDSSTWTGVADRRMRVAAVRQLLPLAQAAVEGLMVQLAQPGANKGPLLDERIDALEHLRALHHALGDLIAAIDAGDLDDDLGQGLAAETARLAKRATRALRDDPAPYLTSGLLLGVLSACGLPTIAEYLAGITLNMRRHATKP